MCNFWKFMLQVDIEQFDVWLFPVKLMIATGFFWYEVECSYIYYYSVTSQRLASYTVTAWLAIHAMHN